MNRDNTIQMLLDTIEELNQKNKKAIQESKSLLLRVQELESENLVLKAKEETRILELERDLDMMAKQFSEIDLNPSKVSEYKIGNNA